MVAPDLNTGLTGLSWYPAAWSRRPPGMVWEDWQPWAAWLKSPEAQAYEYAYDVELPVLAAPASETDPAMRRSFERSNARRIDAVGRIGAEYTIFEARRFTGWSAIAQLQGYKQLWPLFHSGDPVVELVLVTEKIPDDIHALAARAGVRVWVSPTSSSA